MSFFTTDDSVDAIVADIGSYATKIGQAGEDNPRAYFRSNVAILREGQDEVNEGSPSSTTTTTSENAPGRRRRRRRPITKVNYDALNRPAVYSHNSGDIDGKDLDGNWKVANPVDPKTGLWYDPMTESNGHCLENKGGDGSDWADLIPTYLRHGYSSSLGIDTLSANPLLLIERSYNPPPLRQQTLEILMEECEVPAVFFGRDAILSCYACGKTTSTVVDMGYSGTTITPVYEGYVETKGIRRCPIGTYHMDDMALQQLQQVVKQNAASAIANGEGGSKDDEKNELRERQKRGELIPWYQAYNPSLQQRQDVFHRLSMLDIGRECRVSGAGQSINTLASKGLQVPSLKFGLPDGQTVDIPSQNRFDVAELVVGTANSGSGSEEAPSSTTLSSDSTTTRRQQALESLQKDWTALLEAAESDEMEDDDQMDVDGDDKEEKERQAQKYNEASAVGVTSRRTTRKRRRAAASAKEQADKAKAISDAKEAAQTKPKARFYNNILNRACAPYLKTLSEQLTAAPIANMVCDAAFRCNRDQQASVLGNVVLSGGGSCIGPTDQALPDLLREQMESIIHTHTPGWRVKMLSPNIPDRHIASWLGGSILGSLGGFHEMWITKAEYEEWGSAIVNRKCP
eukprot:CAMPEP_0113610838 /NCGR_PEP_ID=MMETSP0017_2-20120614/5237_1 /TAXON_ID=2856 /ORGANISM="Cylindrotheca closterium" /LENGTH=628 /DNA_ID=CAMNT_0000519747 /DNA_START=50 /DNA_END=1936 /DNA_ORIENTATION=+ /assembly_acc=CAM_ASM_000147